MELGAAYETQCDTEVAEQSERDTLAALAA